MRRVDELNDRLGGAHSTLRDTINHLDEILSKNLEDPSEEITHALEPNMVEINDLAREVLIGRQEFSDSEKTVLGITSTIYFASLFMLFSIILLGCSQAVRHRFLVSACAGSNPAAPANAL